MFCPTCGKENSDGIKFCASCGTNLEVVSQVLTGAEEDFFTKFDTGIDQFIARYTDHVFNNNRSRPNENMVTKSWRLLGQGIVTAFTDLLLFVLMCNFVPLRALILLISTPFRLISERSREQHQVAAGIEPRELKNAYRGQLMPEPVPSVTEHTTMNLRKTAQSRQKTTPITDQLE